MEFQEIITAGIIIIVVAFILSFVFTPASDAHNTNIQILNKGDFGENSTLYIKLTDDKQSSLSNKTIHIQIIDENGTVVYNEDTVTHSTGVAMTELGNISAGEYRINITYDGDANYTGSSISKKITIKGEVVEDVIDNSTLTDADMDDITSNQQSSSQSSSSSYSPTPSSSSSSSSSDDGDADTYYDEHGNPTLPVYDEHGNVIALSDDE